jgi:hypothetical protein
MLLVDGQHDIVPPIIPETQEFVHFNTLWCYLFYKLTGEEKEDKGIDAFKIVPSKGLTISALLDRVFPAIEATDNKPLQFVNTKTVAYIFALTIDSVTIFHRESPHSRALQHEASILNALDEMPADEFRTELREILTAFYETYLLRTGAGGRPVPKELIRKFKVKAAPVPDAAPPDASDAVPDPPDDAAAAAAAAAAAPAAAAAAADAAPAAAAAPGPATPPAKRGKPTAARSTRG